MVVLFFVSPLSLSFVFATKIDYFSLFIGICKNKLYHCDIDIGKKRLKYHFNVFTFAKLKMLKKMKFTKEEAYKDLVGRMTANGEKLNLSDRSINEQLDALITLVANEDTELSSFVDSTIAFFKTANANVRNDVSAGINKYKEENPVVKPTEQQKEKPSEQSKEKTELELRLDALEKELANAKREKQLIDIKADVIAKMKDKGVKDKEWVNSLLSEITIADDFDVDTKVESFLNLYNKSKAQVGQNATPEGAGGGKGDTYIKDVIKQASEKQKSQNGVN